MHNRRAVLAAAGGALSLAGCLGESNPVAGAIDDSGDGGDGDKNSDKAIRKITWRLDDDQKGRVELVFKYGSPPPDFLRLLDPSGTAIFEQDSFDAKGEDAVGFGLPINPTGDYTLSTVRGETEETKTLPLERGLKTVGVNLDVDELTVGAKNIGNVPNPWDSYIVLTDMHSKKIPVEEVLLPGQTLEVTDEYPFDKYKDIQIHLFDGETTYDKRKYDLV